MKVSFPFFNPTQVILIDDYSPFLNKMVKGLRHPFSTYIPFTDPFEAIELINHRSQKKVIEQIPSKTDSLVNGNLESFEDLIYEKTRFEQISTIIVDYDMPGINGIEVCKQISSPHIQKILLTGAASDQLALQAFNDKTIDYFIHKTQPNLLDEIKKLIGLAQNKYFSSLFYPLTHSTTYEYLDTAGITDSAFIEFFHTFIKEKEICEYYLLDSVGTYLLLNEEGQPSILFLFDEVTLTGQIEMIPVAEQTKEIIQDLDNYKKAICYYEFEDSPSYNVSQWKDFLFPLHTIQGNQPYYWAYAPTVPYLKTEDVISFKDYKKSLRGI